MPEERRHLDPELTLLLGRIDGKLDSALARMERIENGHAHLEERVSALERWRAYLLGAAALAGAFSSQIADLVTKGLNAS